jgi:ABC-type glutathione transport system ATPase component
MSTAAIGRPLLVIEDLTKRYRLPGRGAGMTTALHQVNLTIHAGESVGLVGESGSGKTTLARCILRLETPDTGRILFDGIDLIPLNERALRPRRADIQVVFQDPYASLNPRMTVADIIAEPLVVNPRRSPRDVRARRDRVAELVEMVGLRPEHRHRYPHEFSGGQRQRIGIARALALQPKLLILDEPTSALDVSVQAQILNLLDGLQRRFGLTMLFISHDLAVIRHICDRVGLLYRGELVEDGSTEKIFTAPQSDYAKTLIAASPEPHPGRSLHLERSISPRQECGIRYE